METPQRMPGAIPTTASLCGFVTLPPIKVLTNAHVLPEHAEMSVLMKSCKSSYSLSSSLDKPGQKRRVLKEVCAFLPLAYIIVI